MKHHRARIPLFLFADSLWEPSAPGRKPKRLVILLHGYEQSGEKMAAKLKSALPSDDIALLAPNGPFPVPRRTESGFRVGYSWYFYNPQSDEYLVDMEIGVRFVAGIVHELGYENVPTTLIGFSQGGYIAPFIAQEMPQVDHVIGLGAQYLVDEIQTPIRYRADSVHGELDEVVLAKDAQAAHQKLIAAGAQGEFRLLSQTGHRIDSSMQSAVSELLRRN